ncbi:MAG: hypothetical protein QM770_18990 [Tepidisphaeraceae bacterium]
MRKNRLRSTSSFKPAFQQLEARQLMAAPSATKVIDTTGPIDEMVSYGSQVFVTSTKASGGTVNQILSADGIKKHTRTLVDWSTGTHPYGFQDLTVTSSGIYFTAVGGAGNGRQYYKVDTKNGGATQITNVKDGWFGKIYEAEGKMFVYNEQTKTLQIMSSTGGLSDVVSGITINVNKIWVVNNKLMFINGDGELWKSDGTAEGTKRLAGDAANDAEVQDTFIAGDYLYYELSNGHAEFWRTDGSAEKTTKITDEWHLDDATAAIVGDWVYFGGGYYNASPNGGKGVQLYRVNNATAELQIVVTTFSSSYGGAANVAAVGKSIYFVAADGEYIQSQGTGDKELYRWETATNQLTLVTKNNGLYPIEVGDGVLTSYYFVAAPTKDDARFGSRALYRTNPVTDVVEFVEAIPEVTDLSGNPYRKVRAIATGSRGFFAVADSDTNGRDTDVFFVATPFASLQNDGSLSIEATADNDTLTIDLDTDTDELVLNLNGIEQRVARADVNRIDALLGAGNDLFSATPLVDTKMYVFGDVGNDTLTAGSGNDTVTGGAGKNLVFGGAGDDRLNGSNGRDELNGDDGADRLYGKGGNDILRGGAGVDRLFGDDGDDLLEGNSSNDKLYGYAGNDTLRGGNQADLMFGGDGDDLLEGNDGNDTLYGEAGTDTLFGHKNDDTLDGGEDTLPDLLDGGPGTDIATKRDEDTLGDELESVLDA